MWERVWRLMMDTLSLDGEILTVYSKGRSRYGFVLRDYRVCKIEGKSFISGIMHYPDRPISDGQCCHIALDEVQFIYEFATKESWEERRRLRSSNRKRWRPFRTLLMIFVVLMAFVLGSCLQ